MRNQTEREREREDGGWTESHIGVTEDVLICSERGGGFCSLCRGKMRETERKWEGRYAQARMEVADCVGVEPGVRLASPSVSSYLGQPDSHVTQRHKKITQRHAHFFRLHPSDLIGTTGRRERTEGGTCCTLSGSVMEGLAAARRGWLCCCNTAFITLMH